MTAENLRTVEQLAAECPAFTEPAIRKYIFSADQNGLAPALVRVGRRVFIDRAEFDRWINARRGQK